MANMRRKQGRHAYALRFLRVPMFNIRKYTVNQGWMSLSGYHLDIAAMLRDSSVVVRTRPRAIPLAMITMRKSTHGFPFASHMGMGLRLAALLYYEFRQKFNLGMVSNFRSFLSALF